jgi:signal peptidase I
LTGIQVGLAAAAVTAGLVAAAVVALRRRLWVVRVKGISMEPTLRDGDRVLVARRAGALVTRGQIVLLEAPGRSEAGWVWRLPAGRPVRLRGGPWSLKRAVAVAGDPVPAPLVEVVGEVPDARVPPGRLVVLGDRGPGVDSTRWGYLPEERVVGVVVHRFGRARRVAEPAR